ncbi:MAG: hypothetical protein JWR09_3162 [Mucilaginibacter sp.]|nr:hypothetical protein [Mucilaginibacter sp.]
MNNNIEFENGDYGTKAIIKTEWQDSFLRLLLDKEVKELELNDGKGWYGDNVDFLQYLPGLKSLIIIDLRIKSIEAIHYLNGLLKIQISTYCKTHVNFNAFPNLVDCGFEWRKGSDSLFECKTLRRLGINRYNKNNSAVFSSLINLEKLTILNSNLENLEGVFLLKELKYLSIANLKKITSLKGIETLQCLEDLEIQSCKGIHNISEVFKLHKLERFLLLDSENIESIKGIENLTELTAFLFYESTNIIDGDLSPLFKLKKLSKISFQNRKHYTNKREEFWKLYAG